MKHGKGWLFTNRSLLTVLALAIGTLVLPVGSAFADDCKVESPTDDAKLTWGVTSLPAEDRIKIEDLFSSYTWALDQRNVDGFAVQFEDLGNYAVWSGGGTVKVFEATSNEEIKTKIKDLFDQQKETFQPRHVLVSTLLREDGQDIQSKSIMLVSIQRAGVSRVLPEPDYTAELRGTLRKDDVGTWKFQCLAVYTDTPVFEPMGR